MNQFTGIYPALISPFTKENKLDRLALRRVIEHNVKLGVHGFYVAGSTGEMLLMTMDERKELLETVVEAVNGRAKVLAHIGCFHTEHTLDLARHAAKCGINAVSSLPPFYYKFTLPELTQYYLDLADAVDVPVLVYNAPELSGVSFNSENITPIFANKGIGGMKFTCFDLYQMQRMIATYPEKTLINGHDEIFLSSMAIGCRSAIGSTFNFMAKTFLNIYNLYLEGRIDEAAEWQNRANEVIGVLNQVGVFRGVKGMLNILGLDCGECRKPAFPLNETEYKLLENALRIVE